MFCDRVLRFLTAVCKKAIEKSPDPGCLTLREVAKPFERSQTLEGALNKT